MARRPLESRCAVALRCAALAVSAATRPPRRRAPRPSRACGRIRPRSHALTNVRIVPEPGKVIEKGTIVVRDGVIEAVGADVKPPADARVIDLAGKTAYAGLIDAYSEITIAADPRRARRAALEPAGHAAARCGRALRGRRSLNTKLRSQGITARLVAPGYADHQGAEHRRLDRLERQHAGDSRSAAWPSTFA